jgi:uncharacterized repeat protein (TIGR03943 family)
MGIPIYLFTGFMDSGKTSLIRQTLEHDFGEGANTLLLVCEDGEIEYDQWELERVSARLEVIENESDFTAERLLALDLNYKPNQVFLEYNGTCEMATFLETKLPKDWELAQSLSLVDASTFELYLNNMRSMMMEQFFNSDVVIFNRCDENTPKGKFRRMIEAKNPKAQIAYEYMDGSVDAGFVDELPFDLNQDVIEIKDEDYGIWYMDALEHPKKYKGKKVKFLALVYNPEKMKKGIFVPGRFAMVCCADDITFMGFMCKSGEASRIPHKSWITITAEIRVEFLKEYRAKGPVLYALKVEEAKEPEEQLVYFG